MTIKERVFHSILFEVAALIILIPLGGYLGGLSIKNMTEVVILLSLIAMCWNFVFNKIFDVYFTENKIERGLLIRVFHGLSFEAGLLVLTLPLIMYILNLDLKSALILDLGIIAFFFIFAIIFNWSYDSVKFSLNKSNLNKQNSH